jgi:hypothetical protein
MKRIILLFTLLAATLAGQAQSSYCLTFDDYAAGTWHPLSQLELQYRSGNKSLWNGGASYRPVTGDSKTDKTLKKDACLIMHHDSLYINCRGLSCQGVRFGNWYAPACIFDHDYFLFTALSIKAKKSTANSAFWFGIVGGAIAAAKHKDEYMCYIFYPNAGTVRAVDQKMMYQLLEDYPDLRSNYDDMVGDEADCSPQIVIPLLKKAGLI